MTQILGGGFREYVDQSQKVDKKYIWICQVQERESFLFHHFLLKSFNWIA